jgi:glycosyltransferase involved in cell wall biosynthesis
MFNIKPQLLDERHKNQYKDFISYYKRNKTYSKITSGQEMFYEMRKNRDYLPSPVIYMVKASLIKDKNITFYNGIIHEDNLFTIQLIFNAHRVKHINKEFYIRNVRNHSIMTEKVSIAKINGFFVCIRELLKFSNTLQLQPKIKKEFTSYIVFSLQRNLTKSLEKISAKDIQNYKNNLNIYDLVLFNLLTQDVLQYKHIVSTLKKNKNSSRYDRLSLRIGHILLFIPKKIYKLLKIINKNLKRYLEDFTLKTKVLFDKNYRKFKRYYRKREYTKEHTLPTVFLINTNSETLDNYIDKLKCSISSSFFLNIYNLEKNKKNSFLTFQESRLIKVKYSNSLKKNFKDENFYLIKDKKLIKIKPQNIFKDTTPVKVSIIMPTFNSELYVETAIKDLLNQTLKNFELICVDDGSTDNTVPLLLNLSKKDQRIKVISKNKEDAAAARNLGMNLSKGKYMIFLDSDDRFNKNLLKKMTNKMEKHSADASVCNADKFDSKTNKTLNAHLIFKDRYPQTTVFNRQDLKENLFLFCTPCPWNKMFLKSFLINNNIKFQRLPRANDVFFTFYSLAKAKRIVVVNEKLVRYRTGISTNLQSKNDRSPFAFIKALLLLQYKLKKENIYNNYVKQSFINMLISVLIYNINTIKDEKNAYLIKYWFKKKGFKAFDILNHKKEYYLNNNDKKLENTFKIKLNYKE